MNKQALIIGGGSKFGLSMTNKLLTQDWIVNTISGSKIANHKNLNQLTVNWKNVDVTVLQKYLQRLSNQNLIFFNQNASTLNIDDFKNKNFSVLDLWKQEKHWNQTYFVSCILPFHIIHSLDDRCGVDTRVAWMLSSLILKQDCNQMHYADYIGNKFQNYILMKNFSNNHSSCFFGINPDSIIETGTSENIDNFISFICSSNRNQLNGKVFKFTTEEDIEFNKFNYD